MSDVIGLGYIGLAVKDLTQWERFGADILGMQLTRNVPGSLLTFRMDEYAQRLFVEPGPDDDLVVAGWEVADAAALDEIRGRLEAGGTVVTAGSSELAGKRRVERLIQCVNPNGIRTEIFCGPTYDGGPFVSQQLHSRFVTGKNGMGHFVELTKNRQESLDFYQGALGMKTSDYVKAQLGPNLITELAFLHCNGRHHSVALVELPQPPKHIHHFMVEVAEIDDVGLAFDRREKAGIPIVMGLGRHSNDKMISFYMQTPSGFAVEFGWGAIVIDDATWKIANYTTASDWGHQRAAAH
jgi:2,3-dihydroxybiphenyl 1,2-dioxygenase